MCGIAGQWVSDPNVKTLSEAEVFQHLRRRGPDAQQSWKYQTPENSINLFHARLSIIDLTEAANQPMLSEDGDVAIVFNGEIYNFQSLKDQLISAGIRFKTSSDTEVLIYGYKHWGLEPLLKKLDGMFAFCIYDKRLNQLLLARDIFGKKPLYYYSTPKEFIFSSDIRVIAKQRRQKLTVNFKAIDHYLSLLTVPQPQTIWNEILQIEPASYLVADLNNHNIKKEKYWTVQFQEKFSLNEGETLENIQYLLHKAVAKRLIADVPVGGFLSGGVDSGLVISAMAELSHGPVKTFTAGSDDSTFDETEEAAKVAKLYGTDHTQIRLEHHALEEIESIMECTGEPFADSSLIPSYYINKAVSGKIKVVLSGDGGDEFFGGYDDYLYSYEAQQLSKKQFNPSLFAYGSKLLSRIKLSRNWGSAYDYMQLQPFERYFTKMGFTQKEKSKLFENFSSREGFKTSVESYISSVNHSDLSKEMQSVSLSTRLLNDYLVKVDRASMHHSLEIRSPFLDKDLVEFAATIPDSLRFKNYQRKYLLKKIAEKRFSPGIFSQKKKGFSVPLGKWLAHDNGKFYKERIERGNLVKNQLITRQTAEYFVNLNQQQIQQNSGKIWSLLCLELWASKNY